MSENMIVIGGCFLVGITVTACVTLLAVWIGKLIENKE